MSGQATRYAARRRLRWLRRVATVIAREVFHLDGHCSSCRGTGTSGRWSGAARLGECPVCKGTGSDVGACVRGLMHGAVFDVHKTREVGERLIAQGRAEVERWAVYCDWLESVGCFGRESRVLRQAFANGPGRVRCGWCDRGCMPIYIVNEGPQPSGLPCPKCDRGLVPGPLPRPDGAVIVRLGRDVLDAIAGQPSTCPDCGGFPERLTDQQAQGVAVLPDGSVSRSYAARIERCSACAGTTGHNLRGVLPPVKSRARQQREARRLARSGRDSLRT